MFKYLEYRKWIKKHFGIYSYREQKRNPEPYKPYKEWKKEKK